MIYEEIVARIETMRRFGNRTGREITAVMLEQLGHPEAGLPVIHIAGTNGKGSVSAFLCEILREAGLRTGCFTSPHLVHFTERICVDGAQIPREDVVRLGGRLLAEKFCDGGERVFPTMFDLCLAMALLYFKEQRCDAVILETGLGGRLDSTNAVGVPAVSVVTKIGYDHTAILGDTLPAIAAEKAGILKAGTRFIAESQTGEVETVLAEAAARAGVKSCRFLKPEELCDCRCEAGMQQFSFGPYKNLRMRMLGTHQYENAAAAILAAEAFFCERQNGLQEERQEKLSAAVREGILRTRWKGRMEILSEDPFLLVDGAHNSSGAEALKDSLTNLFPGEKFRFVMGVMADKDYERMVEILLPLALDFHTVTVESERTVQAAQLAELIRKKGAAAKQAEDLEAFLEGFWTGQNAGKSAGKTVAFGSLYFVGEVERIFEKLHA